VPSVDAAELLLALAREPQRSWHAAELAAGLHPATKVSDADARRYLEQFQNAGLLVAVADSRCRYHPADAALAAQVRMLARAYEERPVTLFRAIYGRRTSRRG